MINKTSVVNIHHKVPYDLYIGRGSIWGNPFSHMENSKALVITETREEALLMHEEWIKTQPELLSRLHEIDGKRLGCFCSPLPCHGETLIKLREKQLSL